MAPEGARFRRSYAMHGVIASGGMATVHVGRLLGPKGFTRRVAIKRLHPELAAHEEIARLFEDEARLSARIAHANVVPMLDVVSADGELLLVMEYVHGEALGRLLGSARRAGSPVPVPLVVTLLSDVLHGLHAAHEATGEDGAPLRIVHRDVSPQNILVGTDGVARVVDFGIAKALGLGAVTRDGPLRGKIPYMPPEQLQRLSIDRRADVYAAGVILWEGLAGRRLFQAEDEATLSFKVMEEPVLPPSHFHDGVVRELDAIVLRALERDPDRRFPDARTMALALDDVGVRAPASAVAEWVTTSAADALADRQAKIDAMERASRYEDSEPHAPAVRAAFASVYLEDDAAPTRPFPAPGAGPVSALPATATPRPRRVALWVGASSMVLLLVVAVLLAARRPAPTVATPVPSAPPSTSAAAIVTASAPEPTASAAVTVLTSVTKPPAGAARSTVEPRWCKVFDPDKQIYVVRSMRVARCP